MIGVRMRQARLVASMTQDEVIFLLNQSGVQLTKAGLSKYERGGSIPKSSLLLNLAKILSVRPNYFLQEPSVDIKWIAFRKQSTLGAKQQDRLKFIAGDIIEGQIWLQEKLNIKSKQVLPIPSPVRTFDEAEESAAHLRKRWHFEDYPIDSLTETIEDKGGIVVKSEEVIGRFDGLSGWANDKYPVTIVNGAVPDDRIRFNLAHELGHLVMDTSKEDSKHEENLAHRFASAFLAPKNVVINELGEKRKNIRLAEIALLKQKYGLSMQALIRRAKDLNIISDSLYKTVSILFSSRGWRKNEPVEFKGKEQPIKFKQLINRAVAEKIITIEKAETLLPGSLDELNNSKVIKDSTFMSAVELMKLSKSDRNQILSKAATKAANTYKTDNDLQGLEDSEDVYD